MRHLTGPLVLVLLMTVPYALAGCQQEGPAQQAGAQNSSAASLNPVEQAADSVTSTATTAIGRAQQTEDVLGQAAQRTAEQVQQTTP